jgi:esterase/lipase
MTTPNLPAQTKSSRPLWQLIAGGVAFAVALVVAGFFAGPRNTFGPDTPTPRPLPPTQIGALEDWVKASEAVFPDIRPGTAKGIVWATSAKTRTPWSVVYLHGYSASRIETAPLADTVAKQLGANAFHTRFTGHGRTGDAMAEAKTQDWMADTIEAVRIGEILGERVLVISVSTGATLATWFATTAEGSKVAAHAMLSPNFGPKDTRADIMNGPWGKNIAHAMIGETRGWTPMDKEEANAWTTSYPTRSLFPMMALVKHVRESDLSSFKAPVVMFYSEKDAVVEPMQAKAALERFGSTIKSMEAVGYSTDQSQHMLASGLKSPTSVAPLAEAITKWVKALPNQS